MAKPRMIRDWNKGADDAMHSISVPRLRSAVGMKIVSQIPWGEPAVLSGRIGEDRGILAEGSLAQTVSASLKVRTQFPLDLKIAMPERVNAPFEYGPEEIASLVSQYLRIARDRLGSRA